MKAYIKSSYLIFNSLMLLIGYLIRDLISLVAISPLFITIVIIIIIIIIIMIIIIIIIIITIIIIIIIIIIIYIIIRLRALLLVAPVYSVRADNNLLSKVSQSLAQ